MKLHIPLGQQLIFRPTKWEPPGIKDNDPAMPTQEEIQRLTKEIRATWTPLQEKSRRSFGLCTPVEFEPIDTSSLMQP